MVCHRNMPKQILSSATRIYKTNHKIFLTCDDKIQNTTYFIASKILAFTMIIWIICCRWRNFELFFSLCVLCNQTITVWQCEQEEEHNIQWKFLVNAVLTTFMSYWFLGCTVTRLKQKHGWKENIQIMLTDYYDTNIRDKTVARKKKNSKFFI